MMILRNRNVSLSNLRVNDHRLVNELISNHAQIDHCSLDHEYLYIMRPV